MLKREFSKEYIENLPKSKTEAEKVCSDYFIGDNACKYNHLPIKFTNNSHCYFCRREKSKRDAEIHRRKIGQVKRPQYKKILVGEKFMNLTATGSIKDEKRGVLKKTVRFLEVECCCGNLYWMERKNWGKTPQCFNCANKIKGITHGLSNEIVYSLFHSAKKRAKSKNISFSITMEDIKIPVYCPILGNKIENEVRGSNGNRKPRENAPSLDRIDSRKGYNKDNIIVMSYKGNVMKNDGTAKEHELIAHYLENFYNGEKD